MNSNRNLPRANRRIRGIRNNNRMNTNYTNRINIRNNKNINNNNNRKNINQRNNLRFRRNVNRRLLNINRNIRNNIRFNQPKSVNLNIKRNNKDMIVNGKDLVLINDNTMMTLDGLYAIIPINPIYWNNTRIKNIAVLNQFYIPLKIIIEFVPVVAVQQKGNVTIGCISTSTMTIDNIENVLISSTCGCSFSCSNSYTKQIDLNSLITQKKLLIDTKIDTETIPFYIYIKLNDVVDENGNYLSPGQFYINYTFRFFNPITNPNTFLSEQNIILSNFKTNYKNIYAILSTENSGYPIGTFVRIEKDGEDYEFYVDNKLANLDLNGSALFLYSNEIVNPTIRNTFDMSDYTVGGADITYTNYLILVNPLTSILLMIRSVNGETRQYSVAEGYFYLLSNVVPDDIKTLNLSLNTIVASSGSSFTSFVIRNVQFINIPQ